MSIRIPGTIIDPTSSLPSKGTVALASGVADSQMLVGEPTRGMAGDSLELSGIAEQTAGLDSLVEKAKEALQQSDLRPRPPESTPEAAPETAAEVTTETTPDGKTVTKTETDALTITVTTAVDSVDSAPETKPEATIQAKPYRPPKTLAVQAQEEAIGKALAGEVVAFKTLDEKQLEVRVSREAPSLREGATEPRDSFRLTVEGQTLDVKVAKGLDSKELMAKVVEYLDKVPAHLRPALKSVELEEMPNPSDSYWAEVYGQEEFTSAATAGGGNITFWNLTDNPFNLSEGNFNHEMGHLIGAGYSKTKTRHAEMTPAGWEDAMKADANQVSDYGSHNPNEDFSEAWRNYLFARRSPEMLAEYKDKHPNRARILEAIYNGTFDGKFMVGRLDRERIEVPDEHMRLDPGVRYA